MPTDTPTAPHVRKTADSDDTPHYRVLAFHGTINPLYQPMRDTTFTDLHTARMAADFVWEWLVNTHLPHTRLRSTLPVDMTEDIAVGVWPWNHHMECWDASCTYADSVYVRGHLWRR
jgi:hypothetical protein